MHIKRCVFTNSDAFLLIDHNETMRIAHVSISRHVPRSQKDPGSWISRFQDPGSWRILDLIYSFFRWILKILDPVIVTFSRDPRDLGSWTDKILLDRGDPGSSLGKLSWDPADLGTYKTITSLYFEHPLHLVKFCFWFHIYALLKPEHC